MSSSGWALNGPVKTPVEEARRMLYTLSSDAHGVATLTDLVVRPTTPPGGGVQVSPGSALIASEYDRGETYQGSRNVAVTIPITPAPSGRARTDLIVMEVLDPWAKNSPHQVPSNPQTFDFFPIRVIEGVAAGSTATKLSQVPGYETRTGIVLARITIPAGRGDVQSTMITDRRTVALPASAEAVFARPRVMADEGAQVWLNAMLATGGEYFPGGAGVANQFQVRVPAWATRMVVDARWMGIEYVANRDPRGRFWIEFGDEWRNRTWPNNQDYEYATQQFLFNSPGGNNVSSDNWLLMDEVGIPAKYRGKLITFVFKAGLTYNGGGSNSVCMKSLGGLGCRISFAQKTEAADLIVLE